MERERFQDYTNNGEKAKPTFSASEMQRRLDSIRQHMAGAQVDAALFTSYHSINYYSDFLFCQFGRRYGLVVTSDNSTSISAGIDGGQPWRRTFGNNVRGMAIDTNDSQRLVVVTFSDGMYETTDAKTLYLTTYTI